MWKRNDQRLPYARKLKFCKAVGWFIDEYNQAQVSINLTNYKKNSIHKTFEEVRKQARKRGLRVTGSEIVGLVPKQALLEAGDVIVKLNDSELKNTADLIRILTRHLPGDTLSLEYYRRDTRFEGQVTLGRRPR